MSYSAVSLRLKSPPKIVTLGIAITCLFGLFSSNVALTIAAALLVPWFFVLLWRPGEPPILLLALGYQWLQVTIKIFNADLIGVKLNEIATYSGDLELAVWLSIFSLAVLALGMRLGTGGARPLNRAVCRQQATRWSVRKLWWLYIASMLIALGLRQGAFVVPRLTQLALAFAALKWALFFVFVYSSLLQKRHKTLLISAIAIELVIGVSGYFAGFKTVFFVLIIAMLTARTKFSVKTITASTALIVSLLFLSLVWTVVKQDYRPYLSGGQRAQIIVQTFPDRMRTLVRMIGDVEGPDIISAVQVVADRASYIDFFGRVTTVVPEYLPHENGQLWLNAFTHITKPRLFFPDKPPLPGDSEITNTYTGLHVAGARLGTSVSIGYVAETYIDFGPYWMYLPILALGFLWGLMYRYLVSLRSVPIAFGYGLAVTVLLPVLLFETMIVKLLGGIIIGFLVAIFTQKLLIPRVVPFLRGSKDTERVYGAL